MPIDTNDYEITVDTEGAWWVRPADRSYPRKEAWGNVWSEPVARRCAEAVVAVLEGRDYTDKEARVVSLCLDAVIAFGHDALDLDEVDNDLLEGVLVKLGQERIWPSAEGTD